MDDTRRLLDERDCEALSTAWARALDFNDQDHFIELFARDGVLELDGRHEGPEAIARWLAGRPRALRTRHVLSNPYVEVLDADRARGVHYLTLWEGESNAHAPEVVLGSHGAGAVGHCQDRYRRVDGDWRFEARIVHWAFRRR